MEPISGGTANIFVPSKRGSNNSNLRCFMYIFDFAYAPIADFPSIGQKKNVKSFINDTRCLALYRLLYVNLFIIIKESLDMIEHLD